MKQTLILTAAVWIGLAAIVPVQARKSEKQLEKERAWKQRVEKLKKASGTYEYFKFLGMDIGGPGSEAVRVMRAARLEVLEDPVEEGDIASVVYKGNHKLSKAASTELEFFDNSLFRVTVTFASENPDLTYRALESLLNEAYGEASDDRYKSCSSVQRFTGAPDCSIRLMMSTKPEGGKTPVVVATHEGLLLKKEETLLEREKKAIGSF
ncbi:MAG: hypothetical protein R6V03_10005 [Kiritimatiellia bacterium]